MRRGGAAPCWTEPVLASPSQFWVVPGGPAAASAQGTAELVSEAGGSSVEARLRKGQNSAWG